MPGWAWVHRELCRPDVTLALLWEESRAGAPDGFGYSWFCDLYRGWAAEAGDAPDPHRRREKLFVDFAGRTGEVVDGGTGEIIPVQIFVAVLGASSFTYAEAVWSQKLPDWVTAHVRAFAYFGGAARQTVSDNLRAGITKACFYEPMVNRTYSDRARHYGTAIVPARPYKPRDKAKVEVGVQVVGRWILARLRHRRFFSLAELNAAIRTLLDELNDRPMRGWGTSRRALFEALDRPALVPLPPFSYEYAEWQRCRVNLDYHVEIAKHYYSVPHPLIRQEVEARITPRTVESSTAASASPAIAAACVRTSQPPLPSTCRVRIGAMASGRTSVSAARPNGPAPTPACWSMSSCARGRTPNRASAPASASCAWSSATAPRGSRPPAPARRRWAPAPTARSPPF